MLFHLLGRSVPPATLGRRSAPFVLPTNLLKASYIIAHSPIKFTPNTGFDETKTKPRSRTGRGRARHRSGENLKDLVMQHVA